MKNNKQRRSTWIVFSLFTVPLIVSLLLVIEQQPVSNNFEFAYKLSSYDFFEGKMSNLNPTGGIEILELNSTLFSDYTEKQRLLKIPNGTKLDIKGNGLPDFPDGSVLIKTFFFNTHGKEGIDRKIIESRLLFKNKSIWNIATYKWNSEQTEAFLIEKGATVPIEIVVKGKERSVNYRIPSNKDCISCHRSFGVLKPIGPKILNLNREVFREGKAINLINHLHNQNLVNDYEIERLDKMVDYNNKKEDLSRRARAYLDINCAHCHSPGGIASIKGLNLSYETPFPNTGIQFKGLEALQRMQVKGPLHMPKIGTSISHEEGISLLSHYIKTLK